MRWGEGTPESMDEAQLELDTVTAVLSNREAWVARCGFLSGWIVATREHSGEPGPPDPSGT